MTINEFIEKFYLHDSSIEKIKYDNDNKALVMEIDYCQWCQDFNEENDLINGKISVTFENVSYLAYEDHDFSKLLENIDTEILEAKINDDNILEIFVLEYLYDPYREEKYWLIKIQAQNIVITKLKEYNDLDENC